MYVHCLPKSSAAEHFLSVHDKPFKLDSVAGDNCLVTVQLYLTYLNTIKKTTLRHTLGKFTL